mgnify:CR=1 FL=1
MARSTFGGLLFYNSDAKGSLGVVFPSHHPRHPFLRLDELVPGRASRIALRAFCIRS